MNLLLGSLTMGLILSLLGLGVCISFRIFKCADITVDGAIPLGGAVAAVLIVAGVHPLWATLAACAAGCAAGMVTGILHTRFKIHSLLAGILVMTALYSVNLRIMGRSNVPLLSVATFTNLVEHAAVRLTGCAQQVNFFGWTVAARDVAGLVFMLLLIAFVCVALYLFFRTNFGAAMRATGDNPEMIRALGVNTRFHIVAGLAMANGLAAVAGALLAQYQGFADVQMGIGMIVWGLASVIIGEALVRTRRLGYLLTGAVMGSVLFRLLVAIALRFGLNPNDLKLITAVFVFCALVLPDLLAKLRDWRNPRRAAAGANPDAI
ncbi:MAG: ABC transporter permease [bacterium]|nr:ABC transporter permease [Candidatus Sumerlaeota bacterium]